MSAPTPTPAAELVILGTPLSRTTSRVEVRVGDRLVFLDEGRLGAASARAKLAESIVAAMGPQGWAHRGAVDARLLVLAEELARVPVAADAQTTGQGTALLWPTVEPWPEEVVGATLLDDLEALLRRHLVLPDHAAPAISAWILHTWAIGAAQVTPRLSVQSPEKRCGKSTLLALLEVLVARPLSVANVSAAALFRIVEASKPSLLVDEADTFLGEAEELRGVLNSGHSRGGRVVRCVGDDAEPRTFATFAAVAIAGIGRPPGTIEDRSLVVRMRRRAPGEHVERLVLHRLEANTLPLRAQLARWSTDHLAALRDADPALPAGLDDRAADNWRPLFGIGDAAGDRWPELLRACAVALSQERGDDTDSARTELLRDVCAIFRDRAIDRISSVDLESALAGVDSGRWRDWKHGRPITSRQVAALLRDFGVRPTAIRFGELVSKGYLLAEFEDAAGRYLSATTTSVGNTVTAPDRAGLQSDCGRLQHENLLPTGTASQPNNDGLCNPVTDGTTLGDCRSTPASPHAAPDPGHPPTPTRPTDRRARTVDSLRRLVTEEDRRG